MPKRNKLKRSQSVPADLFSSLEIEQYVDVVLPNLQSCTQSTQTDIVEGSLSPIRKDSQQRGFILTQESKNCFLID